MSTRLTIQFQVCITGEDIRFSGPSGRYLYLTRDNISTDIGRLIRDEISRHNIALSGILNSKLSAYIEQEEIKKEK